MLVLRHRMEATLLLYPTAPRHGVVFRDPHSYMAHPDAIRTRDGAILMVFNRGPRREVILHPPQDPLFVNVVTRSTDDGESWTPPQVVPAYGWTGTECAGLTELADGRVMLNQWQGNWIPLARARRMPRGPLMAWPSDFLAPRVMVGREADDPEALAPWCRNGGRAWAHFSQDGGLSYEESVEIPTAPFVGGYGYHGGVVTAEGRILLPLTDAYRFVDLFLVSSTDGGRSWSAPQLLASWPGSEFEEPATLVCRSGKVLMVIRDNGSRRLHQIESDNGGRSWTLPRRLDVAGYPAHLAQLDDGRILMSYGWRMPNFGIRARLSEDEGTSWSDDEIILRDDMRNWNLGYPCTIPGRNGQMLTLYYGEDFDGATVILRTVWDIPGG